MTMSPGQQSQLNPNLMMADKNSNRYPNQFFDLSQQYMPPTIKELFRWCTFYYYNSPLISSAIRKMSRYPITDLILEDEHDTIRNLWDNIFNKCIKMKVRLLEVNLDLYVYGNCFVSLHLPFTRMLKCKSCGQTAPIKQWDWQFRNYEFNGKCSKCNNDGPLEVRDNPYKDPKAIRLIRWSPENIEIKHNEYTGKHIYLYTVPRKLRMAIQSGDKDIIEELPVIVLQAVKDQKKIKMNQDNFIHLKNPTLAEQDQGWGKPLILHVLKDMFYFYTLRRAQEAIALEHIVPFDVIYPMPNAQMDPYVHTNLGSWRSQIETIIEKHRKDPNFKAVIPIPIGFGRIGGDGKALLLGPEIQNLNQTIVGGMGIPLEFLFGGLNFCAVSGTYLFSNKGIVRLGEVCPEDIGAEESSMLVDTRDGHKPVALVHRTDKRQVCSIKTRFGLELKGSPIHRVLCLNEDLSMDWRCLKDINPGDFVAKKREPNIWGKEDTPLALCRILGHLCADGSVLHNYVVFRSSDQEDLDQYTRDFEETFGKTPSLTWDILEGCKPVGILSCYDEGVRSYMHELGMYGYQKEKQVPYVIRTSKKECVREFLRALFSGDGCLEDVSSKQCVRYSSMSEELLTQVQLLLQNFGIVSGRYPRYESQTPCLDIASEYVTSFMNQIGFTLTRKNDNYNEMITRHGYRCESNKIPYLVERLRDLKKQTNGAGAWIKDLAVPPLDKEVYTTKEVATLLKRDLSSVVLYIKNGKLKAEKEVRTDGRFSTYTILRADLGEFLSTKGISKRASIGKTTFNINSHNFADVNWDGVKELDPDLYERVLAINKENHIWEEVVASTQSIEEVEMCDLTVYDTHSYVANGLVSHNTGSSVSLRTLENDFIQNRSQLLDLTLWVKDKVRIWLSCPDLTDVRFADFRMADDIQRNQQLIGLNAQGKLSDQTMLTELGYNFEEEVKKRLEEIHIQNYMQELLVKGQARGQGEAQIIASNFQQKMTEMAAKAQESAQTKMTASMSHDNANVFGKLIQKLMKMQPQQAEGAIAELKMQVPEIGIAIEATYADAMKSMQEQQQAQMANQATAMMMMDPVAAAQAGMANQAQLPPGMAPGQVGMQQQQLALQQQQANSQQAKQSQQPKGDARPAPNQKPPRRQGGV